MLVPAHRYVDQAEIAEAVAAASRSLGPEVIRLKGFTGLDTADEPALFFRIVLADWAVGMDRLGAVTGKIEDTLMEQLRPIENWGLFPYFSYRSDSEQAIDPNWAV